MQKAAYYNICTNKSISCSTFYRFNHRLISLYIKSKKQTLDCYD
ncbi:MAG: hypothetical protein [Olavius algarvensis Gamma 3 endosymbiont]|nr:MAG: hypothetical protein [Olavius algarvensis Gamma 3 endosymbiont]